MSENNFTEFEGWSARVYRCTSTSTGPVRPVGRPARRPADQNGQPVFPDGQPVFTGRPGRPTPVDRKKRLSVLWNNSFSEDLTPNSDMTQFTTVLPKKTFTPRTSSQCVQRCTPYIAYPFYSTNPNAARRARSHRAKSLEPPIPGSLIEHHL